MVHQIDCGVMIKMQISTEQSKAQDSAAATSGIPEKQEKPDSVFESLYGGLRFQDDQIPFRALKRSAFAAIEIATNH